MPRDFQQPFQLPEGATEVVLIRHGSARHSTPEGPLDPVVLPELREVYLGDWEGRLNHRVARENALTQKIFGLPSGRWTLIGFNDTAHLREDG